MDIITNAKTAVIILILAVGIPLIIGMIVGISMIMPDDTRSPSYSEPQPAPDPMSEIRGATTVVLDRWRWAQEKKDLNGLMDLYSPAFYGRGMDYQQMRDYQGRLFNEFSSIDVSIDNMTYSMISPDRIRVSFVETLTTDGYYDKGIVEMVLIRGSGGPKIVSETWQPY